MELQKLNTTFSICKLENINQIDFSQEPLFIAKTPDEISLVCESAHVPQNTVAVEHGWRGLKISGVLDFSLIGIVAKIANIFAHGGISIFVVSTYNTDYIFIKKENFDKGCQLLVREGYNLV